jgi:hypothetical protein
MKSTKVPTKSGHSFSIMTVNKDISSGDKFSLVREDEVASIGTDDKLDGKAAGAALRTHPGAAAAGDGPAAGMKMLGRRHIGPQGQQGGIVQEQGMEAFAFHVNRERRKLQRQTPSVRGRVNPNNQKERAGDGRPKERVNSDSPDNCAGNGRLKTRSTKVPTKSGHGFSVETVNKDITRGENFPLRARSRASARTTSSMVR